MSPALGNTAYDFSLFEPREETAPKAPKKIRKAKTAVRPKIRAAAAVRAVFTSLLVISSLIAIMLCNVQLTRLNDEVAKTQKMLDEAKAEEVRLNMALESRTTLGNVEGYAVGELGMQKISQYQVYYVQMNEGDKVTITPAGENVFEWLLNRIMEYF